MTEYGGPVTWEPILMDGRQIGWWRVHVGPDEHETVPEGEQCRCGWINLGVVDIQPLGEEPIFFSFAASGADASINSVEFWRCDRCGACVVEAWSDEARQLHMRWHRS